MSVDYDLVIIGNSYEGIYAAQIANSLQARVALVTQGDSEYLTNYSSFFSQSFAEITHLINQLENNIWGIDAQSLGLKQIN